MLGKLIQRLREENSKANLRVAAYQDQKADRADAPEKQLKAALGYMSACKGVVHLSIGRSELGKRTK